MTNTEPIVIQRDQLPHVLMMGSTLLVGGREYVVCSPTADTLRRSARENLAAAEAIDHALAKEAEDALLKEAEWLCLNVQGTPLSKSLFPREHWKAVARKARELHGK